MTLPGVPPATPPRGLVGAVPRRLTSLRREPPDERVVLASCAAVAALIAVGGVLVGPAIVPPGAQTLPILVGGLLLRRKSLTRLLVVVAGCLAYTGVTLGWEGLRPGVIVVVALVALLSMEVARSREDTGLAGLRGDTVLVELRAQLQQQGRLPHVPPGWGAEAVVRSAGGAPFAGDFVVSTATAERCLEVTLVDVSGKGIDAGTRALLLSGALGGLLGSVPAGEFLAKANDYLCRQDWVEGFATAVHVQLDLQTGECRVESAGHPPVAVHDAGSGTWSLLEPDGPALGLIPGAEFETATVRLDPGDAILLYTDGLVEVSGRDLSVGIDKLLGEAERLVRTGFDGGAEILVDRIAAGAHGGSDDRGLVLVWRRR